MDLNNEVLYCLRQQIAATIDYPSVYMGGPSYTSINKAIKILKLLNSEVSLQGAFAYTRLEEDAEQVKTWRKLPWDSLEDFYEHRKSD